MWTWSTPPQRPARVKQSDVDAGRVRCRAGPPRAAHVEPRPGAVQVAGPVLARDPGSGVSGDDVRMGLVREGHVERPAAGPLARLVVAPRTAFKAAPPSPSTPRGGVAATGHGR